MNRITLKGERPDGELDHLDWREGSGGTIEIFDIAVMSVRGNGRGRRLVEKLFETVQDAPLVFAITRSRYPIAQQFYEHLGFRVVGVLRDFYDGGANGVDAIMYGRSPKGPV